MVPSNAVALTYNLQKKIVAATDSVVLSVSTNNYFDPSALYYFTIKQKEQIIYHELMSFNKNVANQVKTIAANKINTTNGGILSANLYRVTDDYHTFANLTGNQTFCDLLNMMTTIASLTEEQMAQVNMTHLELVTSGNITQHSSSINETVALISINIPGQPACLAIDPTIVDSFLEQAGSIQFFRKPAVTNKIQITTNKVVYMPGEEVKVTVKVINTTKGGADPLQYMQVAVTEDVDLGRIRESSLPGQMYFDNDADTESYSFL